MLDFTQIKGEYDPANAYSAGVHRVQIGKWSFKTSNTNKLYLEMAWEKEGFASKDDKPFASSRLYFSSNMAIKIARYKIHALCDKLKVAYSEKMMATDETILQLNEKLQGKSLDIELVPTGGKNDKGYDVLGVHIEGVGDFFIPVKNSPDTTGVDDAYYQSITAEPAPRVEDSDIDEMPF